MKTGSKLSEDEIQLYNAFVASKKAQPVAVDLAARVFQVCYIDKDTGRLYNKDHINKNSLVLIIKF